MSQPGTAPITGPVLEVPVRASRALSPAGEAGDGWTAWDGFLESNPATGFMQSSWWADFRVTTGWRYFGVVIKQDGVIVGGAMVLKLAHTRSECFYYIPEGPVLPQSAEDAEQVFQVILRAIEEGRAADAEVVSHLRIEPRWRQIPSFVRGFQPANTGMEPRNTICIDLRPPEDAILAQMKPKGRYNTGVARRHGVSIVEDSSPRGLEDFLRIYEDTVRRHALRGKQPPYFRTLIPLLSATGHGSVFFAEYQGLRLAAALAVYYGRRATYFFGGSLGIHRNVMAPYLLHFEIMRRARALGCEWYDLWGVAPEGEPDHPWSDISVFKRKLGGCELAFVPTLDHVYDSGAYARYTTGSLEPLDGARPERG
jgi:lipid II:glycine glycyltransferase (peptidoglycan interpeptide bridge formation enzyme)